MQTFERWNAGKLDRTLAACRDTEGPLSKWAKRPMHQENAIQLLPKTSRHKASPQRAKTQVNMEQLPARSKWA